jgi:hypothetical protein
MAYTKYSLTPANNTAAPPDGAPEGMLPSAVNDTMRDMMAQIRDVGDGVRDGTYTMTAPKITGGTITGVTLTGNTLTNPVITGATLTTSAFNGTVGATTASTGAFTTLTSNGATTFTANTASTSTTTGTTVITGGLGVSGRINAANFDGIVGANTAAAGSFTTINASTSITNAGLTSGRVTYAGASGLLQDNANFVFDGTNVGIGITNPAYKLHVNTTFDHIHMTNPTTGTTGSDGFTLDAFGTSARLIQRESAPMEFYTGATERMRLDSSGNVGIGTTNPSVTGYGKAVRLQGTSNAAYEVTDGTVSTVLLSTAGSLGIVRTDTNHSLVLGTNGTERMRIDTSGNVGIGTSSPDAQLDVTRSGNGQIAVLQTTSSRGFSFDSQSDTALQIASIQGSTNMDLWANTLSFSAGATERMRITSAGLVGIGTSSPAAKLDVNGQINTTNMVAGIRNNITSTDRISVTGATTIFSIATSGSSVGASSAIVLVNGYDTGTTTNSFTDLVLFIGGVTPVVVSTVNRGSPAARTYTASGGTALQLAMASGTYNVANSSTEQAC